MSKPRKAKAPPSTWTLSSFARRYNGVEAAEQSVIRAARRTLGFNILNAEGRIETKWCDRRGAMIRALARLDRLTKGGER
jgi:hypothetical protein